MIERDNDTQKEIDDQREIELLYKEVDEIRYSLLEFVKRTCMGCATPEEVMVLPEVAKLLIEMY